MEAKTKAKYLVEKFEPAAFEFTQLRAYQNAKQCALLCVDEILATLHEVGSTSFMYGEYEPVEYWLSVKEAIHLL